MKDLNQNQNNRQDFLEKQYLSLLNSYPQMQNHTKLITLFASTIISIISSYFLDDTLLLTPIILLSIIYCYKVITYDFSPAIIISEMEYNNFDENLNDLTIEIGNYYTKIEDYLKKYLIISVSYIIITNLVLKIYIDCCCNK